MLAEREAPLPLDHGIHQQPPTVNMANTAICSGFTSHTGLIAAGCLLQRKPSSTVIIAP